MANVQEVFQFGIRLAQFAIGLILVTVSAIQQIDVAGPGVAAPEETALLPTEQLPAAGTMSVAEAEQAIFDQINAERIAAGLAPLALDPALAEIARLRAADMMARDYLSHYDPVTGERADWALEAHYGLPLGGELIYWTNGSVERAAARAVPWWMGSEGHRAGLMGEYGRVGIGLARAGGRIVAVGTLAP